MRWLIYYAADVDKKNDCDKRLPALRQYEADIFLNQERRDAGDGGAASIRKQTVDTDKDCQGEIGLLLPSCP